MGMRQLSEKDLRLIARHVARKYFARSKFLFVRNYARNKRWGGRIVRRNDRIESAADHYLKHVETNQEWPVGTTPAEYVQSLRDVILDPDSGIYTSQFDNQGYHIAFIRRSRDLKGPGGRDWVMIEYRLATERWTTGFQPRDGLRWITHNPTRRNDVREHRPPK